MSHRTLTRTALLPTLTLALLGCGGHQEPAADERRAATVPARTERITASTQTAVHASPAVVVAAERVEVASRLMGYIRDIAVSEGQAVSRGQRLFSVDPLDVEGQVAQARLAVTQAEAAHADAKADHERFANLFKEEAVSRQQHDKAKLQYDLAAARLEQARAALTTAGGQLRYASVTAPMAGVITKKLAHAGDLAAPGRPVLVLENPARLQVETQVPEAVLRNLKPGITVPVEVDGAAAPVDGRVAQISPAADPTSHTFLVKLDIHAAGLRSGTFARVLFPSGQRELLLVPRAAVVNRAGIEGVFVVDDQGSAHFRMVRSGGVHDGRVEIQSGLRPGEQIAVDGTERLESGDRVASPPPR
jgi:RND family efflux transporter MFP subunit